MKIKIARVAVLIALAALVDECLKAIYQEMV